MIKVCMTLNGIHVVNHNLWSFSLSYDNLPWVTLKCHIKVIESPVMVMQWAVLHKPCMLISLLVNFSCELGQIMKQQMVS